MVRTKFK